MNLSSLASVFVHWQVSSCGAHNAKLEKRPGIRVSEAQVLSGAAHRLPVIQETLEVDHPLTRATVTLAA